MIIIKLTNYLLILLTYCSLLAQTTFLSCSKVNSERQKVIKDTNYRSYVLLDSALKINPQRNIYVGVCSLDTTGILKEYFKLRNDSAELGMIYAKKILVDVLKLKQIKENLYNAYWDSYKMIDYSYNLNPFWTEDDCSKLKKGKVWIGMQLEMGVYERQIRPTDNVSDYGQGIQHQWYFRHGSPAYFYTGEDWIVKAYN